MAVWTVRNTARTALYAVHCDRCYTETPETRTAKGARCNGVKQQKTGNRFFRFSHTEQWSTVLLTIVVLVL